MRNSITEGNDRELPPDEHGEIRRAPTPAVLDLQVEIHDAWRHKEAGDGTAMRARSSIESRTDLRLAATNEAMRVDPLLPVALIGQEAALRWADLDATEFGRILSDSRRETALEAIAGHMKASPEYADELKKRSPVLAESARALNDERERMEREIALPMIERNAAALAQGGDAPGLPEVEQREMAQQDARSLTLVPDGSERHLAAAVVGENARNHKAYREELQRVAPQLAREASAAYAERDALRVVERRSDDLQVVPRDALAVAETAQQAEQQREAARQWAARDVQDLDAESADRAINNQTKFGDLPIGTVFRDEFEVNDIWQKLNENQARVVDGRYGGPNWGAEGTVHDIDPLWEVDRSWINDRFATKFGDLPIGAIFRDDFEVNDIWQKLNDHQAKVVDGRYGGPNWGAEGTVHDIDPLWEVDPSWRPEPSPQKEVKMDRAAHAQLQIQAPEVAKEVQAATAENDRRTAEKEDRKAAEFASMQLAKAERAAAWTPEQAADQARKDATHLRAADVTERHYATGDMAIAAERSKAYAETLAKEAPDVAREVEARREREATERAAAEQHKENVSAAAQSRAALIDAAALAAVASMRARETARVVEQLAGSPDFAPQPLRDAQQPVKAQQVHDRQAAPEDPDAAVQRASAIKRPVAQGELGQALLSRFIVSHEKRGLLDKGSTEFTFRNGDEQGRVAFVDAGKAISTEREDRATIRAMVEVATVKNWKEITVSGTDDFKRNAWIEASLSGIKVRGYEPREADKQLLAEMQQRNKPANVITAVEQQHKRDQPREAARAPAEPDPQRKHIDGDALTPHEQTVLDNSRAILNSKALGEQFTEAALRELEAKLRGERVYIGEVIDHGRASYQFDKNNTDSYFVTLKTRTGEQLVWGKGLAEAMQDRRIGEQIVLQNVGKRDVIVQENVRDAQGHVTGTRTKDSHLNAWKAELLSRFSEKARTELANRPAARQPAFGVYDAKAPRKPVQRADPVQTTEQQQKPVVQRNGRER